MAEFAAARAGVPCRNYRNPQQQLLGPGVRSRAPLLFCREGSIANQAGRTAPSQSLAQRIPVLERHNRAVTARLGGSMDRREDRLLGEGDH